MSPTKSSLLLLTVTFLALSAVPSGSAAHAGEGFFEKIGDGWRKGEWVPGVPDVKPKTWQEVVFPICWGSPQDCREGAKNKNQQATGGAQPLVSISYRVDCRDRDTGGDRADSTITVTASTRQAATAEVERLAHTTDLCQGSGDRSRVTVPGSGRYLD
jgi:hypothetical protein